MFLCMFFQYATSTGYNCLTCPADAKYNNATRTCGACTNPNRNYTFTFIYPIVIFSYYLPWVVECSSDVMELAEALLNEVCTVQSLYTAPLYSTNLDIT